MNLLEYSPGKCVDLDKISEVTKIGDDYEITAGGVVIHVMNGASAYNKLDTYLSNNTL